jgi:hypothetical protein
MVEFDMDLNLSIAPALNLAHSILYPGASMQGYTVDVSVPYGYADDDIPIVIPVTTSAVRPDIMLSHFRCMLASLERTVTDLLIFVDRLLHDLGDLALEFAPFFGVFLWRKNHYGVGCGLVSVDPRITHPQ